MSLRDLYLPAGTPPDLAAAKAVATTLCRVATVEQLRVLLEHDWISHPALYHYDPADAEIDAHADALRVTAVQDLHRLLDAFAGSLHGRDVARYPFDRPGDSGRPSIDAYVTAGVTPSDAPTEAYEAWDVVYATERFPAGWCDQLGAALGLLHPLGEGAVAATVTFCVWGTAVKEPTA